jgi:hypothetical protein
MGMLINVDNFTMGMLITYDGQLGGAYYHYIYIYPYLNGIFFGVTNWVTIPVKKFVHIGGRNADS